MTTESLASVAAPAREPLFAALDEYPFAAILAWCARPNGAAPRAFFCREEGNGDTNLPDAYSAAS